MRKKRSPKKVSQIYQCNYPPHKKKVGVGRHPIALHCFANHSLKKDMQNKAISELVFSLKKANKYITVSTRLPDRVLKFLGREKIYGIPGKSESGNPGLQSLLQKLFGFSQASLAIFSVNVAQSPIC